ncbi:NosR/NirI family protein [Motiliproteus coralliicola]|nr:NosR/NirI family protein [Motiliproteus coralliicola]
MTHRDRIGRPLARGWLQLLFALCLLLGNGPAFAMEYQAIIEQLFPKATRIEPKQQDYPVYPVYQLNELLGYAYESTDLSDLPGFAGKPIKLMIGLDTAGRFSGVKVLDHHEPVFLHGLGQQPLFDFVDQYQGQSLTDPIVIGEGNSEEGGPVYIDGVSKATVSVVIVNDTVLATALQVARNRLEGFAQSPAARPKTDLFEPLSIDELIARGYLQHWQLNRASVEQELGQSLDNYGDIDLEHDLNLTPEQLQRIDQDPGQALFSELWVAYLNAPIIGRNLLGEQHYRQLIQSLKKDEQVFAVLSRGPFGHVKEDFKPGTVPGRLSLQQQGLAIELRDLNALEDSSDPNAFADGIPEFDQAHLFRIKGHAGFNPGAESQLVLNVDLARNHLISDQGSFSYSHKLPDELFELVEVEIAAAPLPLWMRIWKDRTATIATLLLGLGLLSWVFVRQRRYSYQSRFMHYFRWGYLWFTLLFIGFYAQGQLSVVNIYTLLLALWDGFDIKLFLLDPVIFILWSYTFISLFLWGRGLFCGWLCPFGALQEMVAWVAAKLKIKQWKMPEPLHRRLILIKYPLLLGLVVTAFGSLTLAEQLAEVEPFKTSITLVFVRHWPFVLYALLLLGMGLFVHKFYCRYLCPLGAGLAVLGRLRLFNWLDRIEPCGSPCQLCKRRCGINAIHQDGRIDYDECIQCLECVVILNDPKQCVASLQQAKKQRRRNQSLAVDISSGPVNEPQPGIKPVVG